MNGEKIRKRGKIEGERERKRERLNTTYTV